MGIVPLPARPTRNRKAGSECSTEALYGHSQDGVKQPTAIAARPLYPLGSPVSGVIYPRSSVHPARGGSVPASTILLIEADATFGETISSALTKVGYTVTTATDPDDGLAKVSANQLVILDVVSGEKSAADICREI